MMRHLILVAVLLAGAGIPVQVASNNRLEKAVHSAPLSVAISFVIGSLAMVILTASGLLGHPKLAGAWSAPWCACIGGLLSAAIVILSIIALPQSGAAAVIAATVFGQLLAAAILDHFGWLGVPQVRINVWRIVGIVLLLGGTLLMQRK